MRRAAKFVVIHFFRAQHKLEQSGALRGVTRRLDVFKKTYKEEYQKALEQKK